MEQTLTHIYCYKCGSERENAHPSLSCQECGIVPTTYHITFKQWLKYLLLQLIPIFNIYLLVKWGFMDKTTHPTLRSYAKFSLILTVIGIFILIIVVIFMLTSGLGLDNVRGY